MHQTSSTLQGFVGPEDAIHQVEKSPQEHEHESPPPYKSAINHQAPQDPIISSEDFSKDDPPEPVPSSLAGNAYTREPPMSANSGDSWRKYDDTPGCCCSTTGGCCFSSRGGCCFSDTEGCCFSTTKGCCFSSNAACCFSGRGGSPFCFSKSRK
ncbi:hypothetical protein F5883DRAFT_556562 [Diaporthe sp. PMI_573]|nr:hypothetical protein F5883DRAFT_556562 [Diaporthaceae sp. PMI_573]